MRVAVVGLGIAGLRSCQLLERAGAEVVAIEARGRVGGRLCTVQTPSGWYEAGGEWIDADHRRTLALLAELGCEATPADSRPGKLLFQGETCADDDVWSDAADDARAVREEAVRFANSLKDPPWANPQELDQRTVASFLDRHCASARGRWLAEAVVRSDEGTDSDRVGLLGWLSNYRLYAERGEDNSEMSAFRFPEGGQRLCEAMARGLSSQPLLERPVKGIQQGESHIEVWLKDEVVFADRAIVTVPPGPLLAIDFEPELPDETRAAWERIGSAPCVKVALRFRTKFWDDPTTSGSILADLPFQQVWDGGRDGDPVLLCYVCGREAEQLASQPGSAVQDTLRALSEALPEAAGQFVEGEFHDWVSDPWSNGGFASLSPGAVHGSLPWLRQPHGRVHWAGEATADWIGFIEGALESAERVVNEVLDEEAVLERA